jgi:hypothetical protein
LLTVAGFVATTITTFVLAYGAWWLAVVPLSGGQPVECAAVDCGAVAEFTLAHRPLLEMAFLIPSALVGWVAVRKAGRRSTVGTG